MRLIHKNDRSPATGFSVGKSASISGDDSNPSWLSGVGKGTCLKGTYGGVASSHFDGLGCLGCEKVI